MWWLLKRLESSVLNVMDGGPIVKMVWVVGPIFVQFTFCWRPLLVVFFVVPLVLDLAEKPTDSNCNSGCASPRLCEEMTLGSTFQIGGSPIDFSAKLASRLGLQNLTP